MAIAYVSGIGAATKQTKTVEITTNGTHEITPNFCCVLDKVIVNTNVPSVDTIEPMLDEIIAIQESLIPPTLTIEDQFTGGGSITITFTKGMTWSEWVASEYNTVGAITIINEYSGEEQPTIRGSIIRGGEWSLTVWGADVMDANSFYLIVGG